MNFNQMEREPVVRTLDESRWNITQAARVRGASRDTLRYRIEKLGLSRP
jgi:transcriptional regulator of acetoin/glycerol metabolism